MTDKHYTSIAKHYEKCFDKYGNTCKGVDWPNEDDAIKRHRILTSNIKNLDSKTILDFGCGAGHLIKTLEKQFSLNSMNYTGMDISKTFIEFCELKYPQYNFLHIDILTQEMPSNYDFVIANGVFTEKQNLEWDIMWQFFTQCITVLWGKTNTSLSFNLMSKNVDWERDDLFHVSFDKLSEFLSQKISRHFIIRQDYGLYEYTVQVFKHPHKL